jgi:hypothetical protein
MRVTWFCLVSHIFAEEKVPTDTINVLVRLFLSSCRRFWILGEKNLIEKQMMDLPPRTHSQDKRGRLMMGNRKKNQNLSMQARQITSAY